MWCRSVEAKKKGESEGRRNGAVDRVGEELRETWEWLYLAWRREEGRHWVVARKRKERAVHGAAVLGSVERWGKTKVCPGNGCRQKKERRMKIAWEEGGNSSTRCIGEGVWGKERRISACR